MIKDTSLSTELTFAILPVVIPINPRSGKIVKATKKVEDNTEDAESSEKQGIRKRNRSEEKIYNKRKVRSFYFRK